MALSNEDKKDVQGAMGKAIANKVSKVTRDSGPRPGQRATIKSSTGGYMAYVPGKKKEGTEDSVRHGFSSKNEARSYGKKAAKSKALQGKKSSFESMNKARKAHGVAPKKDRATKGLYDFLDKFD